MSWSNPPQNQSPKMAPDKASAEVAKGFRAVCEIMTQKVQLTYKRDIEIKAFKKREHDYNNKIAGAKQFPAVAELYTKYNKHHKEIVEPIDKKLTELSADYQNVTESFAESLVKALPVNEIKTRHVIEAAKGELSREAKSLQPVQGDRLQKLEELVYSLKEKHEAQNLELTKLKKLNDELRAGGSKTETLEKEKDQLRTENLSMKSRLDILAKRVETVETWKAELTKEFKSQGMEYSKALEQAKAEWGSDMAQTSSNAVQDNTTREEIAALREQDKALGAEFAALRKDVDGHEALLANVDIESLDDTIAKVQEYPRYSILNDRVTSQQVDVDGLKESLHSTKQRLESDLAQRLKGFSDKIIQFCGRKFDAFESRVKVLEVESNADATPSTKAPSPQAGTSVPEPTSANRPNMASDFEGLASRLDAAESRLTAEETKATATALSVTTLQTKTDALQTDTVNIRREMNHRYGALETMVESLDEQWKNVNTAQMAQYMLEHLSRLQPSQVMPELRQIHLRLVDVENLVRDEKQERRAMQNRVQSYCEDMADSDKRPFSGDEKYPALKRARIEGINSVNGVENGHAHP